ncbi:MAG: hypothetical protein ACXVYB_00215 [Arthrobacter sp.]
MATISPSIKVHGAVLKGELEVTIYTQGIVAVSHDGTGDRAVVHTSGGQSFRVHETYDEVLAKIKEA